MGALVSPPVEVGALVGAGTCVPSGGSVSVLVKVGSGDETGGELVPGDVGEGVPVAAFVGPLVVGDSVPVEALDGALVSSATGDCVVVTAAVGATVADGGPEGVAVTEEQQVDSNEASRGQYDVSAA